ncbi:MAG TPA: GNAT family N-acetyltransferase [Mucilaginibacter sp.]|nr:GNAT family N-acetyltransferase [Mucilaginibacter sp.]
MEGLIIRKAVPADLDTLLTFEQGIVEAERPFDRTLKDGEIHYYDLEKLIADPEVQVLVAEIAGELIGSGYARITVSKDYLKHDRHCYLGFMYVRPEYRGKGINSRILHALKEWTLAQGITELRLEVYKENQPAVNAYEKAGFTPNLLEMRLGIGPQDQQ